MACLGANTNGVAEERTNTMEKRDTLTFWGRPESVGLEDEPHSVLLLELMSTSSYESVGLAKEDGFVRLF